MCMPRNFGRKLVDGLKEEKRDKSKNRKVENKKKKVVCQNCVEFE